MSRISIINRVINENYNINQSHSKDIFEENEEMKYDNSFDQLLSLQTLIQKHSGLKELCKFICFNYLLL
jgi:hypothetical protein